MTSHYDTPEAFDKTTWFVTYCRPFDSLLKVKLVSQTAQHTPKQVQELHTSKVKHAQLSHQNAKKIVSNRNVQNVQYSINLRYKTPKATTKARHHVI